MQKIIKILCTVFFLFNFSMLNASSISPEKTHISSELSVGFATWPGFDIIYYAQVKQLFKKHGISVNLIKYPDQESTQKALQNHEIDAAMISIWDVIKLKNANNFSIVLVTNVSAGADGIVAQNGIESVADLKSKRISAQADTVNELILLEALQKYGMSFKDVKMVDLTNEEAIPKLMNKEIDAAVVWEPLLSEASYKISGNIIHTTADLDSLVIDTFTVNNQALKTKRELIKGYVSVWFDIMQMLDQNPQELFDVVGKNIHHLYFGLDYAGLQAGTLKLNKEMFLEGRLSNALYEIDRLLKQSLKIPDPKIESSFVRQYKAVDKKH